MLMMMMMMMMMRVYVADIFLIMYQLSTRKGYTLFFIKAYVTLKKILKKNCFVMKFKIFSRLNKVADLVGLFVSLRMFSRLYKATG